VTVHQARKRFGQHFLVDQSVLARIASEATRVNQIAPAQWLEIGPGLGALTDHLITKLPALHAIEIDRDLGAHLLKRYAPRGLTLTQADVLTVDFGQFAKPLAIIGNLPYNISTPLLIALIEHCSWVSHQVFMLQREVVLRMVAQPGTSDYGRLAVMLQAFYKMEHCFDVPPEAFDPPPRVDSAVVRMTPLAIALVQDRPTLESLLVKAFSQRRKMLRAYFLPWLAAQGIEDSGLEPTARAEQIPVAVWTQLANRLSAIDSAS
jgi:16S rRNA (adenine1518-N6/adenine1519-N6)-dimethyltransferase